MNSSPGYLLLLFLLSEGRIKYKGRHYVLRRSNKILLDSNNHLHCFSNSLSFLHSPASEQDFERCGRSNRENKTGGEISQPGITGRKKFNESLIFFPGKKNKRQKGG